MKLSLGQIARWIGADLSSGEEQQVTGYSIDSRTIAPGELFFAVHGERFDGHEFVQSALTQGAEAAVVRHTWPVPSSIPKSKLLIVQESPKRDAVLEALQQLANAVRRTWGKRIIGVTGSAGKTTTKEAIAQVLGVKFKVFKSAGNFNNAFGLPLQLLQLQQDHDVAVLELGMNHAGEIAALARIAEPNWAVVSNVAAVHLEFFPDGLDGIARAKYELVEALPPDGIAFLNADDLRVVQFGRNLPERTVLFGTTEEADVRATEILDSGAQGTVFSVSASGSRARVTSRLVGRHNVYNALAAIAVGLRSGISLDDCALALGDLRASDKRGEIIEWRGAKVLNDTYNSNPKALDAMVHALMCMPVNHGGRRIVVAGEMLELGSESEALHRACGALMSDVGVDLVIGVRGMARRIAEEAARRGTPTHFFDSPEKAGEWLEENLRSGDAVLLKASRGVKLERALDSLKSYEIPGPGPANRT